jgi:hypothetical protein
MAEHPEHSRYPLERARQPAMTKHLVIVVVFLLAGALAGLLVRRYVGL